MKQRFDNPIYTYQDYKNWKEDWELIEGFPMQLLPSASPKHSKVQAKFIILTGNILQEKSNCNCNIFVELDWKINETTVVRPDVMIICGDTNDEILEFPPILVAEILSPKTTKTDRVIKFDLYQENGVKYYLMIDVNSERVEVFELIDNKYKQVDNQIFKLKSDCEISLDFSKLWK